MKKGKTTYVCSACGCESLKWSGRCSACGEWNTLEEVTAQPVSGRGTLAGTSSSGVQKLHEIIIDEQLRYFTGIQELDRLLGGGIVEGSMILLGGDPGIGKSTLLLQICGLLRPDLQILYVSGEESARQLKLRAERLGVSNQNLSILCEQDIEEISGLIVRQKPDLVIIDSIQTMKISEINSAAGSVVQVRESTNLLMQIAKQNRIPMFIVGHVNKDGNIAGPKVLEHIVDVVLYFEGDHRQSFRILRAVKNRYGSTNEIAVFEMKDNGLSEVRNPSAIFLSERALGVSGNCVCSLMQGSRPIMAEVQALVTKTGFGIPRRVSNGFDYNRLAMIMAVLEKRAGYFFGSLDVYINIVGGLKADEPAADLSVALALVSGLRNIAVDGQTVAFAEIGLGGELRSVQHLQKRVYEAQKLGFTRCLLPAYSLKSLDHAEAIDGIELFPVKTIRQAIQVTFKNIGAKKSEGEEMNV